jgi:hypothetical protein
MLLLRITYAIITRPYIWYYTSFINYTILAYPFIIVYYNPP